MVIIAHIRICIGASIYRSTLRDSEAGSDWRERRAAECERGKGRFERCDEEGEEEKHKGGEFLDGDALIFNG